MSDYSEMLTALTPLWNAEELEINTRQYKELTVLIGCRILMCFGPPTMPDKIFEAKVIQVIPKAAQYEIDGKLVWKPFVSGPTIYAIPAANGQYIMRW